MSNTVPLTVNVPLDDLSPEAIRQAIIDAATDRVLGIRHGVAYDEDGNEHPHTWDGDLRQMRETVRKAVDERVIAMVEAKAPAILEEAFAGTFQPMNAWGERVGEPTTIRAMAYKYAREWLEGDVRANNRGELSCYDRNVPKMKRLHFFVRKEVNRVFISTMKGEIDKAAAEIRGQVAAAVTEMVNRMLGPK